MMKRERIQNLGKNGYTKIFVFSNYLHKVDNSFSKLGIHKYTQAPSSSSIGRPLGNMHKWNQQNSSKLIKVYEMLCRVRHLY